MPTIAVDFDGVIHAYSKGWHDGTIYDPPMPGALDALRTLMRDYAVFVHTSRNPIQVSIWLREHGFKTRIDGGLLTFWNERDVLLVTWNKLPAIAYIDDRGIRFESWDQALAELRAVTKESR
ncbi:hypothetical protein HII36_29865 [Nonomuraea sp. NN258]|uniref:hypothetical protein n=1 Tax=Nonomuraea antri TaxID=2730852 RepID=UPI00156A455E|nr:hypothetical protein [Nonomuraea antri]NRQ36008.1 hypothetical protein [Nonomuraea antri]